MIVDILGVDTIGNKDVMMVKRKRSSLPWHQTDKVTVESIANDLNMSPSTVSFVMSGQAKKRRISEKTTELVLAHANKLGYVPNEIAQGLRYQRTNIVALLLGNLELSWADITARGANGVFDKHGLQTVISVHYWNRQREHALLKHMLQHRYEGIICQPILEAKSDYEVVLQRGIPLVMIDILPDMLDVNYVAWDAKPAVKIVAEYLISSGRKRITFVGFPVMTLNTIARLEAYQEVMNDSGLLTDVRWLDYSSLTKDLVKSEDYAWFGHAMSQNNRPDAFLCLNDATALTVMQIMNKIGVRIPDDVAITGMGNLPITHDFASNLTTLVEPIEEIGKASAEVISELIEHPGQGPIHRMIKSNDLIIRGTT
jgi:LacI family transcriptional regulator